MMSASQAQGMPRSSKRLIVVQEQMPRFAWMLVQHWMARPSSCWSATKLLQDQLELGDLGRGCRRRRPSSRWSAFMSATTRLTAASVFIRPDGGDDLRQVQRHDGDAQRLEGLLVVAAGPEGVRAGRRSGRSGRCGCRPPRGRRPGTAPTVPRKLASVGKQMGTSGTE